MSGVDLILDTNAVIAWSRQEREFFASLAAGSTPGMTLFTLGELYFGARNSARVAENMKRIAATITELPVLLPENGTARRYGEIRDELKQRGTPIPENDLWIAALALEIGLPVMSRDHHLRKVNGLKVVSW